MTSKNIIFVPIQYRLGTLGVFGDGKEEFSGNAALFDMATALRWVHEYIIFFGGDPKRITLMGHGNGAIAAQYLTTTQRSSRSFVNGVIAMSGTAFSHNAIDETPIQSIANMAVKNNCPITDETELVKCLRRVRTKKNSNYILVITKNPCRKVSKILFVWIQKSKLINYMAHK